MGGLALAMMGGESEDALALIERSTILNPNSASAWMASGMTRAYKGDSSVAIEHLERAAQLSPLDPLVYLTWYGFSFAHFADARHKEASAWVDRALRAAPNYLPAMRLKTALCGLLGQAEEGRKWVSRLVNISPDATLTTLRTYYGCAIQKAKSLEAMIEGLRKAGLPE